MGGMKAADLDAVVVDAYGTLVTLVDPVPALVAVLAEHGERRSPDQVRAGVKAEIAYYAPRAGEGRDEASLSRLQRDCARVFLDAVDAPLDPEAFAPAYVGALRFEPLPGVEASLEGLRARGLELAVVGNWDLTLRERLEEAGLAHFFACVVHSADKPAPDGLQRALERLSVEPGRSLYVGDTDSDRAAAAAAGMPFAPAPLAAAVAALT
jgi:HAD superfamily hydrolase (TIGR01509 family)